MIITTKANKDMHKQFWFRNSIC